MDARPQETARARAPKADLRRLVEWGLLCEGQELVFLDFKGHARKEHRAIISGNELKYGGMLFSMSGLASILLKEMGYIAESVRGPDHWATAEGQKVRAIWERALRKQRK
jgi:hypothetical protein